MRGIGSIIMGMNGNHQKIRNQYHHLLWEAVKCEDKKRSIFFCDEALHCANKMPSPEKEDMLANGFIIRGILNHMRHEYEKAYEDFTLAIRHNPCSSDALYFRAFTRLVKGPFLRKGFPDHHVIYWGWSDISSIKEIEKDTGHFAHGMKIWRQKLSEWEFFPVITHMDLWRDFCKKFPVLYHVVPEKYECAFSQGLIVFRTFTNLRIDEDVAEGIAHVTVRENGVTFTQENETEACVFCLSQTPNIANIRKGGILYEIKTECFMQNFLHKVEFLRGGFKTPGLKYFGRDKSYKNKDLNVSVSAGSVFYGRQVNFRPSSFVKSESFLEEQEVRIVVDLFSDNSRYIDSTSAEHQTLTVGDNKPAHIKVPKSSEWQRKM